MSAPDRSSRFPASRPRRGGRAGSEELAIIERAAALLQVTARKGRQAVLAAVIAERIGLELPGPGQVASAPDMAVFWLQPESWLLQAPPDQRDALPSVLSQSLKGIAAVVDQSHGRCLLELRGVQARDVLARLCRLDLHERAFPPGRSAVTLVGHVPCIVYRSDDMGTPGFGLIVGSTFAEWLLDELGAAAASYGWSFSPAHETAA